MKTENLNFNPDNKGRQLLTLNRLCTTGQGCFLSDADMLSIAKEIGFAESAFVRKDNAVRIFTTDEEVPQAGHPILGTYVPIELCTPNVCRTVLDAIDAGLAEVVAGCGTANEVVLSTKKGPINVRRAGGQWIMSQDPAEWLDDAPAADVAQMLLTDSQALIT